MGRYILKIDTYSESTEREIKADCIEKRKRARIPICVPISCVSVGPDSKPLDYNMGIIRDVSQTGVGIEANMDVSSDRLILTFVDMNNYIVEIAGKVVFSKPISTGIFKIGVKLEGNQLDVLAFVRKLVKFHHYIKKTKCID